MLLIVLFILFGGCSGHELCYKEEYYFYSDSSLQYNIYIPCKYYDKVVVSEEAFEYNYWYADSSVIYVSTFHGAPSLNYDNIRSINDNFYKLLNAFYGSDTLVIEGTDKKGNIWKNITIHKTNYGYVNVPPNKVNLYDRALKSFRKPEENSINKKD